MKMKMKWLTISRLHKFHQLILSNAQQIHLGLPYKINTIRIQINIKGDFVEYTRKWRNEYAYCHLKSHPDKIHLLKYLDIQYKHSHIHTYKRDFCRSNQLLNVSVMSLANVWQFIYGKKGLKRTKLQSENMFEHHQVFEIY